MICPKCDEGTLKKITFIKDHAEAVLCAYCGTVWFAKDPIRFDTGHDFLAFGEFESDELDLIEDDVPEDEAELEEAHPQYERFY